MESGQVDPITVKEIVGHADLKILFRYVHLTDSKHRAVNAIVRKKKAPNPQLNNIYCHKVVINYFSPPRLSPET